MPVLKIERLIATTALPAGSSQMKGARGREVRLKRESQVGSARDVTPVSAVEPVAGGAALAET